MSIYPRMVYSAPRTIQGADDDGRPPKLPEIVSSVVMLFYLRHWKCTLAHASEDGAYFGFRITGIDPEGVFSVAVTVSTRVGRLGFTITDVDVIQGDLPLRRPFDGQAVISLDDVAELIKHM